MNMKKITNKIVQSTLLLVMLVPGITIVANEQALFSFSVAIQSVEAAEKPTQRKTRKTPAMRERIYSQLARAQKLADEGKVTEGLEVLDRVKSRIDQINSYEKAMLWNFYGFIYYSQNDTASAVASFEKVVEQTNIPESLELSTLFSLAQLQMAAENYKETIKYLDRWAAIKGELSDNALVLKANAYYAMKNYPLAEKSISKVVSDSFAQNKLPKENWLVLKRALHYELKQTEQVTRVSELLVKHYSKASYWIDLANMYGETEQTDKQLSVMEAAYQQGFVTKKIDIQTLSQLYFENGAPYKSAKLLSKSIDDGIVLENVKILNYLAQAWLSAKETEKAVPVLIRAANLSKSGNLDARLAEAYVELEQWKNAIASAKTAQQKGSLDLPGNVDVILGIAHFNLKQFDQSIASFEQATSKKSQKRMAEQWIRYAEKEKEKHELLAEFDIAGH
jgi:hypothetical protein